MGSKRKESSSSSAGDVSNDRPNSARNFCSRHRIVTTRLRLYHLVAPEHFPSPTACDLHAKEPTVVLVFPPTLLLWSSEPIGTSVLIVSSEACLGLDPSTTWKHAVRQAQWRELVQPRPRSNLERLDIWKSRPGDGKSGATCSSSDSCSLIARLNWKKVITIARRAGVDIDDDDDDHSSDSCSSSSQPSSSPSLITESDPKREVEKTESAQSFA